MSSYNKQQSCVIYARQSSGKESESESVTMQIRKCRALAEKQKLNVIAHPLVLLIANPEISRPSQFAKLS